MWRVWWGMAVVACRVVPGPGKSWLGAVRQLRRGEASSGPAGRVLAWQSWRGQARLDTIGFGEFWQGSHGVARSDLLSVGEIRRGLAVLE